ncbi:MAG: serine hydrolase [bacterium]|nr:serine hydrolase [bacterium]
MKLPYTRLRAGLGTLLLVPLSGAQELAFPAATPEEVGLTRAALDGLAAAARRLVDEGRVVGAELLVVKDRRTVLHEAWGWKDREDGVAMEPGTLYDLRSMTKPVVGTAAQALIDEGVLDPAAPVVRYLPAFDRDRARDITVEHLLTHRSGLEWSVCMGASSLAAMAECCAELGPTRFLPGTDFLYSNAGSNTLAAAMEVASGQDLEALVAARVLAPLGMRAFVPRLADDERLTRMASTYALEEGGGFERVWSPADGPRYRFLQGAQGLVCSAADYARFLALWIDEGTVGATRVLSPEAVRRGLTPASLAPLPTTFPGRRVYYAQHWRVWTRGHELELFGHSGSDGTFAWAWPERDLIVLYLTQTVLTTAGVELEEELDRWLLDEPARAEVPDELRPYVGHYWSEERRMVRTVYADGEGSLTVDVPEVASFKLVPTEDPLRWQVRGREELEVGFERDAEGRIAAFVAPASTGEGPAPRLVADPGLPSVDALMALRFGEDGDGALSSLGLFRLRGTYTTTAGQEGIDVLISDGLLRSREETGDPEKGLAATVCNGARAATVSRRGRRREITGSQRAAAITGRLAVVVGDWRRFHETVEVLARTDHPDEAGREVLAVRATSKDAPATVYLVDPATGLPLRAYSAVEMPFGSIGKVTSFEDYREVEGVWIPFRWVGSLASAAFGGSTVQYGEIETHLDPEVDLEGDPFAIDG